jgi:hypothetical protein
MARLLRAAEGRAEGGCPRFAICVQPPWPAKTAYWRAIEPHLH